MSSNKPIDMPWVILALNGQIFAISTDHVHEMLISPSVSRLPQTPAWVRGVINVRGQAVPLMDLRKRFGMKSLLDELEDFCTLMEQREQDHVKWLTELEASVREQRVFTLATDPHKCAFGKWYDTYQSRNLLISLLLKKFDAPHKLIHGIAAEITQLMNAGGRAERALNIIDGARQGALKQMIDLFHGVRQLTRESNREVAVILNMKSRRFAVCVDSVESVEKLEGEIESLPLSALGLQSHNSTKFIGRRAKNGGLVLVVETERLLNSLPSAEECQALAPIITAPADKAVSECNLVN